MFRLYGKILKRNHITAHHVVTIEAKKIDTTAKLKLGLESLCNYFDIENPMWQAQHSKSIEQYGKARFSKQHFIDAIDFDHFEIEIIEDEK